MFESIDPHSRLDEAYTALSAFTQPPKGSVSLWIEGLRGAADQRAANHLYQRYFTRLVGRLRYRTNRKVRSVTDSEDTAQYVLAEVLMKLEKGKYPQLEDRESLWAMMIRIGEQRTKQVWRDATADKRDVRIVIGLGSQFSDSSQNVQEKYDPQGSDASPSLETEIEDMVQYLTRRLSSKEYRDLLVWELQGFSPSEMKQKLQSQLCRPITSRTFRRWRETMRKELTDAYTLEC